MISKRKIAVIGAGPAGLTAAYQLVKEGYDVTVFEASDTVGGMSKSLELWGQRVDLGPHRFFSNDLVINNFWLEIVGRDYQMVNRLTRIYYADNFFHYPLKPFQAIWQLGILEGIQCIFSFLRQQIFPINEEKTFETWVIRRFGRKLYSIFFKSYSEKLWGISCKELDEDFAAQRIKKLSLFSAIWEALKMTEEVRHQTLVEQFAYPKQGTGMVYERMAERILKRNGRIKLQTPVVRVMPQEDARIVVATHNGEEIFDHIISSMPLSILVRQLPNVPEQVRTSVSKLRFRNTTLVYLLARGENLFPDQWLYIHASHLKTGRITNFSNWVTDIKNNKKQTILCLEYWSFEEDEIWKMGEDKLIELAKNELNDTGLISACIISEGKVVRIPKCYPVYQRGYKEPLQAVQHYLDSISNLSVIGRYGAFKYNNQDHSILMGLLAAENIIKGETIHNLWNINTDYGIYQEKASITEVGLSLG